MKTRALKIVIASMLVLAMCLSAVGAATITKTKFNSNTGLISISYYVAGDEAVITAYDPENEENIIYFDEQKGSGTGEFNFTLPEDYEGETVAVKVGGTNEASSTVFVSVTPTPAPTPDPESTEVGGIYNYIANETFGDDAVSIDKTNKIVYTESDFDIDLSDTVWKSYETTEDGLNFSSGYMYVDPLKTIAREEILIKFAPITEGTAKICFDAQMVSNGKSWNQPSYFGAVINTEEYSEKRANDTSPLNITGLAVGMARVEAFNGYTILNNTSAKGIVRFDKDYDTSNKSRYSSYNVVCNDNVMHSYEYIIDMDKKTYSVSIDGAKLGDYSFYNDDITAIDALKFSGNSYADAAHNNAKYIVDNITVKATQDIEVGTLKFYNETGTKLVKQMQVRPGKRVLLPTAATKRGSTFVGWTTEPNGAGDVANFDNISGDMTVYAAYATKPTVIFMDGESEHSRVTIDYATNVTAPVLEGKDGKEFVGWYLEDGKEASFVNVKADMTVYAKYMTKAFGYSETFDNGTAIDNANKAVTGSDFTWSINDDTYGNRSDGTAILKTTTETGYDGESSNALNINPKQTVVEDMYIKFPEVKSGVTKISLDFKLSSGYSSSPTLNFAEITNSSTNKRVNGLTPYSPTWNKPMGTTTGLMRYDSATESVSDSVNYPNASYKYVTYDRLLAANDTAWHRLEYTVDMTQKTYTMVLDGETIGTYSFFDSALDAFDSIHFKGNSAGAPHNKSNYWIDNISVTNYSEKAKTYTVKFYDEDGTSLLDTVEVEEGGTAVFTKTAPTKTATAQYTYTFKGWDGDLTNITANKEVKATYTQTVNKYTVTFKDWDGSTLKTEEVEYGSAATAPEKTPTREDDDDYSYSFSGWDNLFNEIKSALTVTAQYNQTPLDGDSGDEEPEYVTVIWGDFNGSGTVDAADLTPIQNYNKGKVVTSGGYKIGGNIPGTDLIWGDLNGSGTVDTADLTPIKNYNKGKSVTSGGYKIGETVKIPVNK